MTIREIRVIPDPVLRTPCEPIKEITPAVRRLVEDLLETVESADIETVIAAVEAAGFGARRTAFVELRDDIQGSEQGEIYCRERGIALRVFSNEGEARRWLLYDG